MPAQSVKPLTASQKRLIKTVDFSRLDPIELEAYRSYLLGREIVRQEAATRRSQGERRSYTVHGLLEHPASPKEPMQFGEITRTMIPRDEDWLASRVMLVRKACRLSKKFVARIPGNPRWVHHPAARVLVLWPEWPRRSYFSVPIKERLRRIKIFAELLETDRLPKQAYLINPQNPSTIKIATIQTAILTKESASGQEQLNAYKAELMIHDPELFKRGPTKKPHGKKQGRAVEKAKILDDLNSYAAYKLCVIGKIPPALVINPTSKGPKTAGKLAYGSTKALLVAARHCPKRLQEFRDELITHLVPLGPTLEPLEISSPDPVQLDTAIAAHPEPWQGSRADLEALEQADLDENAQKILQDGILKSIARLDRKLRRTGGAEDRAGLESFIVKVQGILQRIPRKS